MIDQNNEVTDIKALELQVDKLISKVDALTLENGALHNQQGNLTTDRAELIHKIELARSRIESIILRLKSMETKNIRE